MIGETAAKDQIQSKPYWQPVRPEDRFVALDILRGVALIGVLLVNIWSGFRVPLATNLLVFHTRPDWPDRTMDLLIATLLEFKAMAIFCLLFGVGIAIFAERASLRGVAANRFLIRRYIVLLVLGLCHLLLIWNGDILTLYAVCAFLLLPFLQMNTRPLALAGIAAIVIGHVVNWGFLLPTDDTLHRLSAEANATYARGNFRNVLEFHWRETRQLILPLLILSVPQTCGLMALGIAAWRQGIFRNLQQHGMLLNTIVVLGGTLGGSMTLLTVYTKSTGHLVEVPSLLLDTASVVPLALAYTAGLMLLLRSQILLRAMTSFGSVGQMALTNYLTQSVVLSFLFYGCGLNGQIGSMKATGIGLALYILQVAFSRWWLRHHLFGPVEWLWRSCTYGRWQTNNK